MSDRSKIIKKISATSAFSAVSSISLTVNSVTRTPKASPSTRLLDFLRDELKLTGTKEGCGEGECGACMVLLDGKPVNSCLVLLGQCDGREVTTIEGISVPELFKAFEETGAVQCGFCTPGFVVSAYALLKQNPNPTAAEIKEALSGNLCRCTGYKKIIEAVQKAAKHNIQRDK
ncbi:MAG: (2Fe-2S)-binding protein [Candidatus Neomarinimicrobiota bacterium]